MKKKIEQTVSDKGLDMETVLYRADDIENAKNSSDDEEENNEEE